MSALLKMLAFLLFVLVGGFVVYVAGGYIDRVLHPGCDLCRLAGVSLFGTFTVVFGLLTAVAALTDANDPHALR